MASRAPVGRRHVRRARPRSPNLPRFLRYADDQAAVGVDGPTNFLDDMLVNGAKGYFDAVAMRPCVFPTVWSPDPDNAWSDLARAHDVMTVHGDGDEKVWMTEFGAPTSDPDAE